MNRAPVIEALSRIELLAWEIDQHVPADKPSLVGFRADLAGLLNVTACATYENCVKAVIHDYAGRQGSLFRIYTENQYEKINSRIEVKDLRRLAKIFHPEIGRSFSDGLKKTKQRFLQKASENIETSYEQLLEWRHSFAHTGTRVTTVEEVLRHHRIGKRVIILFSDAFSCSNLL